jgi:hypothetical protein
MTIEEMHIAVNLGVQKIASFQVDNLLPEEIDHELNIAMERFIKQRYSPNGNKYRDGFEQSQKRIDDLRNLVVDRRLKAFYVGETLTGFEVDRVALPMDYMFLVNAIQEGYYSCLGSIEHITSTASFKVVNISMSPPVDGAILTEILVDDTAIISNSNGMNMQYVTNINNYDSTYRNNIAVVNSRPDIVNTSVAATLNQFTDFEATPTVDSNTLKLLLATSSFGQADTITAKWVADGNTYLQETTLPTVVHTITSREPLQGVGTASKERMWYVQHDDLYSILYDPFNTSTYDKIKFTIQENFIDVHSDNTFFTTFVTIKYIRQPKQMDFNLGVGCELPQHTHQEIVEMAIQSILEAIQDPRYNTQSREVLESE